MTQTLQEAMLKAGLISKEKLAKAESDKKRDQREQRVQARQEAPAPKRSSRRPPARPPEVQPKKSLGFIEGKHHHHLRTACDACRKSSPDVEYYQHKNRSLTEKWLCVKCADTHNIPDETRQTKQSQHALSGLFRREYGATKIFK